MPLYLGVEVGDLSPWHLPYSPFDASVSIAHRFRLFTNDGVTIPTSSHGFAALIVLTYLLDFRGLTEKSNPFRRKVSY